MAGAASGLLLGAIGFASSAAGRPAEVLFPGLDKADFRQTVNLAKSKVFPAVVFIKCVREGYEQGEKAAHEVSGSGVIISEAGEVLSNWHVVEQAVEVRCLLIDGRVAAAKVLGADKDTDVALLQLQLPAGGPALPFARLGDSRRLTEGDFVMAMGAPWGLARSVSIGIISCTRRFLPGVSEYSCWLQTDASISPGNSGGPLVNTEGEVIGINTRGVMAGGDTGFAVPIEVAQEVAGQIRRQGKAKWSWTGFQLQPLKDFNRNIYFDATNGVLVAETDPGSPARLADFRPGDRLIRIDSRPATALTEEDLPAIRRRLGLLAFGQPVKVEYIRQDRVATATLTPREKGRVEGQMLDCPRWDFTLKAINQFDNPDLHFQRAQGVFIFGVKQPGNAAMAGLLPKDILTRVDGQEVTTLEEVKAAHKKATDPAARQNRVVMSVLRNGLLRQVVLDYSRGYNAD
jgi:serine protease Do